MDIVDVGEELKMALDDSFMDAFNLRYYSSSNSNYGINHDETIRNFSTSTSKPTKMVSFGNHLNNNPNNLEMVQSSRSNAKVQENPYDKLRIVEVQNNVISTSTRTLSQAQEHVLAERKRRKMLSDRFVDLSSIIPGLKRMDKNSVLGGAAKYIKDLEERAKKLEEEEEKTKIGEAVISVKIISNRSEIEARISDKNVLLRIHYYCNKSNTNGGVFIMKTLGEIEKHHLTIITTNVMPFANTSLLATIIALKKVEFCMTAEDLVKTLHMEILKYNI